MEGTHCTNIRSKAGCTLGVIRRNCGPCSKDIKLKATQALVRPQPTRVLCDSSVEPVYKERHHVFGSSAEAGSKYYFVRSMEGTLCIQVWMFDEPTWSGYSATRRLMTQCMKFYNIHINFINIWFPPCTTSSNFWLSHSWRYHLISAMRVSYKFSFLVKIIPVKNWLP